MSAGLMVAVGAALGVAVAGFAWALWRADRRAQARLLERLMR